MRRWKVAMERMVAPLARADPDQTDLHLADIGLPGIDELDGVAGATAVLDINVELGLLEPALVLRQMHRRLHAHGEKSSRTDNLSCADAGEMTAAVATTLRSIRVDRKFLLMSQSPV